MADTNRKAYLPLSIKAASDEGIITGVANVMEIVDMGGDKIRAGAFTKTLQEHQGRFPLELDHGNGIRAEVGVGEFSVKDDELLLEKGLLNLDARDIREEIYPRLRFRQEHGLPAGLSIVYQIPRGKSVLNRDGVREITEIKLLKVGIVDIPMNQDSYVSAVKGIDGNAKCAVYWNSTDYKSLADYLEQMALEEAQDRLAGMRWNLTQALERYIKDILAADAEQDEKIAAIDMALMEYHRAMFATCVAFLGATPSAETGEEEDTEAMANTDADEKAGRVLSATNEKAIRDALAALVAVLEKLNSDDGKSAMESAVATIRKSLALQTEEPNAEAAFTPAEESHESVDEPNEKAAENDEAIATLLAHFVHRQRAILATNSD